MIRTTLRKLRQQYYSLQLQKNFRNDFQHFAALAKDDGRFDISWSDRYPCLNDATTTTGYDRHYILHTGWAARVLARTKPALHVDISSSLYFVSIASAIVPFKFYDYRPARLPLPGVSTGTADLTKLPFSDSEISSLSCMHVIEHIGLGRYGDPIDPTGDLKAARELRRVVARGGQLLLVAPVGRPRIMFNAHRIYSYEQVLEMFHELHLCEFSLIRDDTAEPELITNAPPEMVASQSYACGCFWFKRK
jgi:SAM-dependent methyltransferase